MTARVPNSVESLTVMAEAMNSSAMVSITNNGSSVSAGAVDLVVGPNEIDITVTAEDRTAGFDEALSGHRHSCGFGCFY